ncbi:hypothetical protein HYT25_03425 [Candidatus Pacearchaeota archaeon]|nr:hypothetical protein [Candidatus Pacearchaeota archaeon]
MKVDSKSKRGRLARAAGARFELKVRTDLEKQGWILDKWTNNVNLGKKEIISAKPKFVFNPKTRMRIMIGKSSGFPDFICFKLSKKKYDIIGVEVKMNGFLDAEEKEKCRFLLNKKIFSKIRIAKKGKKRGEIEYIDFAEKYDL